MTALTGLGVGTSLQLVGYAHAVMAETPYAVILALVAWLLVRFSKTSNLRLLVLASALAGLSGFVRVTGLVLIGVCLMVALHQLWRAEGVRRWRYLGRSILCAVAPGLALVAGMAVFNLATHGELRTQSRSGSYLYYCVREVHRLESDDNKALARIESAMDEYESRREPGTPPLKRYACTHAVEACQAVYGMTPTEADNLLRDAAVDLIREYPFVLIRGGFVNAARTVLTADGIHRFVPGGAVGDGWHLPPDALLYDPAVFSESNARLQVGDVRSRYLPPPQQYGPLTGPWREWIRFYQAHVVEGPSITRLTDSLYEDFVLLCLVGACVSLYRMRPGCAFVLGTFFLVHLMATSTIVALPRYTAGLDPVLKIYAALACVEPIRLIAQLTRRLHTRRIPETSLTAR